MSSRRPQENQNELQKAPGGPKSSDSSIFSDGKAKTRARAQSSVIFLLLARVWALREGQKSSEGSNFSDFLASRSSFGPPGRPKVERELTFQ